MDGFLIAFLLVFALALGGRDQWLVADWADRLGRSLPLVVLAILGAALSAAAMAWFGAELAAMLPPRARRMLIAFALGLGAAELLVPVKRAPPREPTRSFGAFALVLLARQLGDGARFAVLALAAAAPLPAAAGLGGAIGGAGAAALGWAAGAERLARWRLQSLRFVFGAGLLVAAVFVGLEARFAAS